MNIKIIIFIFSAIASISSKKGGLSRAQKVQKGIVKPGPLKLKMTAEELQKFEDILNKDNNNSLTNKNIKVSQGEKQIALGVKQTTKTFNVVLSKEGSENCSISFSVSGQFESCNEVQDCNSQVKKCLGKLGALKKEKPQIDNDIEVGQFLEMAEKQNTKNETAEEESNQMGQMFENNHDDGSYFGPLFNLSEDQESEPVSQNNVQINLSEEEQTPKSQNVKVNVQVNSNKNLMGGFQPCKESEEDLLHQSLIYLQKYAYLQFEHLYIENIALCSHQFFARSNNINFLLSFDSTKKCSMSVNVQWDAQDQKRKVRKVTVYQNEGDESYGIFARNPVQRVGLEFPDCADYFATPLYRMTLDNYKNLESFKKKREEKLAKLSKKKEKKTDKI